LWQESIILPIRSVFPSRPLIPFIVWLFSFYAVWLAVLAVGNYWSEMSSFWPVSLAMLLGSYVAGSTPMGGGTIGFPVLVLAFDYPGSMGRNFGLAIQSIGMVSASIYILCMRRPVDWGVLFPCLLGAVIGMPLGAFWIAPVIPDLWVKLTFSVIWASFGLMHLVKLNELIGHTGENTRWRAWDFPIGFAAGVSGGVAASITGVGIDMILYAVLVLLFQADLRIAIPSSVIAMAFTSVVGIASNLFLSQRYPADFAVKPEVFYSWLAAAPVVILGAPIGAWVVNHMDRRPTLIFVSILCLGQFVWTLFSERVTGIALIGAILGVMVVNSGFHLLYKLGGGAEHLETHPKQSSEDWTDRRT
jgi:uncharacterized protein